MRNHVQLYDGVASTQYEFNGRLRNGVDLYKIAAGIDTVIAANDYHCLAAVHIGFPKHIMKIGGRVYINSKIIDNASEKFGYVEESAFYPDLKLAKSRFKTIKLQYFDENGYVQTTTLEDINAICAQHLIDSMNGLRFQISDEL